MNNNISKYYKEGETLTLYNLVRFQFAISCIFEKSCGGFHYTGSRRYIHRFLKVGEHVREHVKEPLVPPVDVTNIF